MRTITASPNSRPPKSSLSQVCGGQGALSSVSIFANSPAFEAAAEMARPYVESGKLAMALHLNLVEGRPCAPVTEVPLLVNQRGTFTNDFVGLLKLSMGAQRWAFRQQLQRECVAQIQRYLTAFPQMKRTMRVDSHQHTHAVPAVFDALSQAVAELGVTVTHLRCPIEPLSPHRTAGSNMPPVNLAKDALITWLWRKNRGKMPAGCEVPLFCGVVLSGAMDTVDWPLLDAFESLAADRGKNVQVLFHPVSVPIEQCLDPENAPSPPPAHPRPATAKPNACATWPKPAKRHAGRGGHVAQARCSARWQPSRSPRDGCCTITV